MERGLWATLKDVLDGRSLEPRYIPRLWQDHPEKFSASKDWQAIVAIEGMMTLLKKPQESSEKRTFLSDGSDGFQDVKAYFEALDPETQKAVLGALKFAQRNVQRAVKDIDNPTANYYHSVIPTIWETMFGRHNMIPIPPDVPENIRALLEVIETPKREFNLLFFFGFGRSSSK